MAPLLTVPELREHIETDLPDAALQRLLGDADASIVKRFGAHGEGGSELTEEFFPSAFSELLFPQRVISSVTSVTEYVGGPVGEETETELAEDDYRVELGGRQLRRLASGTNAATSWPQRVVLVYQPMVEGWERARVTIDLVKLAINYNALRGERAGDYQSQSVDYQQEREKLLLELDPNRGMGFV